jgi:hemolysin D
VIANRRLLDAEIDGYHAKLASLDNEIARQQGLRAATAATIAKLEKTVPLLQKQADARQELVDSGYLSSLDQDNRRMQVLDQEGELKTQRAHLAETTASAESARRQRQQAEAEFLRDGLNQKDEAEKKIAELAEELRKAHQRAGLQTLTAPIDGVVQQLDVHTIGGVVTPAQKLLSVVPEDAGLEIEAMVLNRDIGFIQPGQKAEIKVETFAFTKYGTVDGTVVSVSHDAVQDEKQGLIYPARVRLAKSSIDIEGRAVPLGAGMAATVEIKTETRKIIEYLISPLVKYAKESLRER